MTIRIRRMTLTVVGFAGLSLLGLLICGLNAGRSNAQQVNAPFRAQVAVPRFSANSHFPGDSAPQPVFDTRPYSPSSALSTQPITVAIKDGPELSGEPVDVSALHVKTIFGPVSIPLDRIAGVRIADDPRQPATVCLANGDSLTGVLANDAITIKTGWGTATITRDNIVSITTTQEPMRWEQHDDRWRVVPVEPVPGANDQADSQEGVGDAGVRAPSSASDLSAPVVPSESD